MKDTFITLLLILVTFSLLHTSEVSTNVLVGVIEDDRKELANWKEGPSKNRVIRPLFMKQEDEWILSTSHPEEIQWTIAFDGKNRGSIKSSPYEKIGYSSPSPNIHYPYSPAEQSLIIGDLSNDYSGWISTNVNRPLVLVSKQNFSDPEKWKLFQPSDDQIRFFRSVFRAEYSKVVNCDENERALPNPWQYENNAIHFSESYRSSTGNILVSMYLTGGVCGMNNGPFQDQLFLIRPDKTTEHIVLKNEKGELDDTLSLRLVDAGDYDADGHSEAIFFVSGYNEDGYAIFYNSFTKSVKWTWNYH